jgi:hypothetical protein
MRLGARRLLASTLVVFGALLLAGEPSARAQSSPFAWNPKIAIVWPQDGQGHQTSVQQARAVNVSVWPTNQATCAPPDLPVTLYVAEGNNPGDLVGVQPQYVRRTIDGSSFPSAEFDAIPADIASNPNARYGLVAGDGGSFLSNVWVHIADPRTLYPRPLVPTGVATGTLSDLDLRIQVVWPHDAQGRYAPPDRATFVNVAVDIFQHGTTLSAPADYPRPQDDAFGPYLAVAEDNRPLHLPDFSSATADRPEKRAQETTYAVDGAAFPRWVFNDVPVQPGHQYHFLALMGSTRAAPRIHPTIWTHAADARTILPAPQVPPSCTA